MGAGAGCAAGGAQEQRRRHHAAQCRPGEAGGALPQVRGGALRWLGKEAYVWVPGWWGVLGGSCREERLMGHWIRFDVEVARRWRVRMQARCLAWGTAGPLTVNLWCGQMCNPPTQTLACLGLQQWLLPACINEPYPLMVSIITLRPLRCCSEIVQLESKARNLERRGESLASEVQVLKDTASKANVRGTGHKGRPFFAWGIPVVKGTGCTSLVGVVAGCGESQARDLSRGAEGLQVHNGARRLGGTTYGV